MADLATVTKVAITATENTSGAFGAVQKGLDSIEAKAKSVATNAFGYLTAAFGAGAFVHAIKSAIDFADSLNDLSKKTGIAVGTLGGLGYAASTAGVDLESVGKGAQKLAEKMAEAAGGGKQASAVFDAMKISVKNLDGSLKGTDQVLAEVADRFASYADGPEKAALATELMSKAGANLIPLLDEGGAKLREMIADYQKYGGVTTDTAARADQFNDTLAKIKLIQGALFRELASALLPTLQAVANIFLEAKQQAGGFGGVIEVVVTGVKGLAIAAVAAVEAFKFLGTGIGSTVAAIVEFFSGEGSLVERSKRAWGILKEGGTDMATSVAAAVGRMKQIWVADTATIAVATENNLGKRAAPVIAKNTEETNKLEEAFKSLEATLRKQLAALHDFSEEQKTAIELEQKKYQGLEESKRKYLLGIAREIDAQKEWRREIEAQIKLEQEAIKQAEGLQDAAAKALSTYTDQNNLLEKQGQLLYLSDVERAQAIVLLEAQAERQKLILAGDADGLDLLDQQIARRQQLVGLQIRQGNELADWRTVLQDVTNAGADFITDFVEHGTSAFHRLWDNFKRWALEALAQIAARQVVVSIVGALGLGGVAGSAAANGLATNPAGNLLGAGQLGSAASNLWNTGAGIYTAATSAYGAAAAGYTTAATGVIEAGSIAGGSLGAGTLGGSLMAGLEAGLAAVPVAGWIALGALVIAGIISGMDKGPATRTASFGSNAGLGGGDPLFRSSSSFGSFGVFNDQWFSESDQGKEINAFLTGLQGIDNAIAQLVGSDMTGKIKDTLASVVTEFEAGTEHTATSFGQIMQQRYSAVAHTIDEALGTLVDNFQGTGDELGKFVVGIVGVHETLKTLDSLSLFGQVVKTSDVVALTAAGGDVTATFKNLVDVFSLTNTIAQLMGKTSTDAFGAMGLASLDMRQKFVDAMGGMTAATTQVSYFLQHFYTDSERSAMTAATALRIVNSTFADLGLNVPASSQAFRELLNSTTDPVVYARLIALAPWIVALYGDIAGVGTAAADASTGVNAAADAFQRVKDAVAGLDTSLLTREQRNANNATNAPWLLTGANIANGGAATGFNVPWEQGHQGDIASYLHSQQFLGLTTGAQDLILQWVHGYIETWGTADQAVDAFTQSTLAAADAAKQLANSAQSIYLQHLSPEQRSAYYSGQVGAFNTANADQYAQFGFAAPTTVAGALAIYEATRNMGAEARHFGDLVITSVVPALDAMDQGTQKLTTSVQSLVNTITEAQTGATIASDAASQLVQFVGGDLATQLTTRLGVLQGRSNAASAQRDVYSAQGYQYGADVQQGIINDLAPQINLVAGQLARLTTLTAQYGADKAAALFNLEQKYNDLFASFQNFPDVLATLNTNFHQQWQAIVEGTGTGVNNTLSELARLRQGILDYVVKLQTGDLSPLSPGERLASAGATFDTLFNAAQGNDVNALGNITGAADTYLRLAASAFTTASSEYQRIYTLVTDRLEQLGTQGAADPQAALVAVLPNGHLASQADIEALNATVAALLARIAQNTQATTAAVESSGARETAVPR